ncbi:hypothetical protein TNCV_2484061 [Trichonephila clavipes]|uniref:Uncharacterized protein n=1 Tax=Trichonephila clavipes TaxID=2585209 RepID=A0A8X6VZV5_TRICX|nr:hypothetical protein TNCV_2484061 [Trichonephila clavipes]
MEKRVNILSSFALLPARGREWEKTGINFGKIGKNCLASASDQFVRTANEFVDFPLGEERRISGPLLFFRRIRKRHPRRSDAFTRIRSRLFLEVWTNKDVLLIANLRFRTRAVIRENVCRERF